MQTDPRRRIPRTDDLLVDPAIVAATHGLHPLIVRGTIRRAQQAARCGDIEPESVRDRVTRDLATLESPAVINATGVIVHTNLGRSVLSKAAQDALTSASGYAAVEFDMATGQRARRGRVVTQDLLDRMPGAEDALVVNNGAAALLLAVLALPGEVLLARGEMVEIGDGFRLHEMLTGAGITVTEVGATNRVHPRDYADALGPHTGCILKVHPSNFETVGFTASVSTPTLAQMGSPVVVDIGSGLLEPHPFLIREPDAAGALADGAGVVTFSTDKLLGGPQGGVIAGRADIVQRARRHPMARAMRADKLTLAALSATLRGGHEPPTLAMMGAEISDLQARLCRIQERVGGDLVHSHGRVGGGSAPGTDLAGPALLFPASVAAPLREHLPAVVSRVHAGRCVIDLRCVPTHQDEAVAQALARALADPA